MILKLQGHRLTLPRALVEEAALPEDGYLDCVYFRNTIYLLPLYPPMVAEAAAFSPPRQSAPAGMSAHHRRSSAGWPRPRRGASAPTRFHRDKSIPIPFPPAGGRALPAGGAGSAGNAVWAIAAFLPRAVVFDPKQKGGGALGAAAGTSGRAGEKALGSADSLAQCGAAPGNGQLV